MTTIESGSGASGTIEFSISEGQTSSFLLVGQAASTFAVDLEYTLDGGSTWSPVYINGTQVQVTDTNTHVPTNLQGDYRLDWTGQPVSTSVALVK